MIKIYYTFFDTPLSEKMFDKYLGLLPEILKADILKCKRWEDRQARLLGKLLLKKGMADMSLTLDNIRLTTYGRPFIDYSIDFSISHTSGCVVCAITKKGRVGIDIEAVTRLNFSQFENYFTKDEWKKITAASVPTDYFFHFWTRKEAVVKADGRALTIPLNNFEVIKNSVILGKYRWKLLTLKIKEKKYKAHLAYNEEQFIEMIFELF